VSSTGTVPVHVELLLFVMRPLSAASLTSP